MPKQIQTDISHLGWRDFASAVWRFLGKQRRKFLVWNTTLILVNFYQLLPPLVLGAVIDFFTQYKPGQSLERFYQYVVGLTVVTILIAQLRLTAKKKLGEVRADAVYNVRSLGFKNLLDASLTWHEQENSGNKIQRIEKGASALREFLGLLSREIYKLFTAAIGAFIAFLFTGPVFTLLIVIYIVLMIVVQKYYAAWAKRLIDKHNQAQERASGNYYEGLSNVLTIKTLGAQSRMNTRINASEEEKKLFEYEWTKFSASKWKIFNSLSALGKLALLLLLAQSIIAGTLTVGAIIVLVNYFDRLDDAVKETSDYLDELIQQRNSVFRMLPIFAHETESTKNKIAFPEPWQQVTIVNGSFNYQTDTDNFKITNLNFNFKKGETIGIVGRSGSGKSTLGKLLLGLYKLTSGEFKVDDTNYYDILHESITDKISVVLQESELFNLSLQENITLLQTAEPEKLALAIKIAQLDEVIAKLPNGLETLIGEKGYRVSGGERQRIGIARAVYKNADILIFDEATSSLDSHTENIIQQNLTKYLTGSTLIIIAHRLSTLKDVERIVVFEQGQISEQGGYAELIADHKSKFFELVTLQKQGQEL